MIIIVIIIYRLVLVDRGDPDKNHCQQDCYSHHYLLFVIIIVIIINRLVLVDRGDPD